MRHLINGSNEPLWRKNARDDADKFIAEHKQLSPSRRKFLVNSGKAAAALLTYVEMRRAVAFPFPHGAVSSPGTVTGITNARTGTTYQYLPDALHVMQSGDTILLPAGKTYQYLGATQYYANNKNTNPLANYGGLKNIYLGNTSPYTGSTGSADYGAIQAVGTANNGRALISPPYGVLASDFHVTDTEMFFDAAYPVTNWAVPGVTNGVFGSWGAFVPGSFNLGQFAYMTISYTGVNVGNNSLTGVSIISPNGTIPAGTIVTSIIGHENKAAFIPAGSNPGWTFTNIEIAYIAAPGAIASSIQQQDCLPGGPYVGSCALNNCYIHDVKQGSGLGAAGIGMGPGIFAHYFNSEFAQIGDYDSRGQTHNIYIQHLDEFIMDNCWSHNTASNWLVKTRAALNILTYNQIRGERTDLNTSGAESGGVDISNGGLSYLIGNIHQVSLHANNPRTVNWAAEGNFFGSTAGGASNPIMELYAVNNTLIGPSNGSGIAPYYIWDIGVQRPAMGVMGQVNQSGGTPLTARGYSVATTSIGSGGGETIPSSVGGYIGGTWTWEMLDVGSSKQLTVASPQAMTAVINWNCYANYSDPVFYTTITTPTAGNFYWWDSGHTQPVFAFTSGGNTISVTGTLASGDNKITGVTGLAGGLGNISQLQGMIGYVGGSSTGLFVASVDTATGVLTLNGNYGGTAVTAGTITFGYYLWCGITYQTSLGDSVNSAFFSQILTYFTANNAAGSWYDGSYSLSASQFTNGCQVFVPPGQKLIFNPPPTGPAWATGVNLWAQNIAFWGDATVPVTQIDANMISLTKQNASAIAFGGSAYTSPASVLAPKAQKLLPNYFLQNASPLAIGANFTESNTGLVNNNPTAAKLQWFRRAGINYNGITMDCWYAVVPGGGLSGYSEKGYLCYIRPLDSPAPATTQIFGSVGVWRGCAANPFDGNFQYPASNLANATSISTAGGNVTVLAAMNGDGTAGSGFTQISSGGISFGPHMNASYKPSVGALSGQNVTETAGALPSTGMIVDVLAGASSPPSFISEVNINTTGNTFTFSIASANAGDILYLMLCQDQTSNVAAIGQIGPPPDSSAAGQSPVVVIQNNLSANYQTGTGGWTLVGETGATMPGGYVTLTTNLQANPYTGSFGVPTFATVFADSVQADLDLRPAVSSPAKNAASNPGSVHSQSLIPVYQTSWHGTPTPGTPIPAKAARSDIGPALTGSIGALT